MISDDICICYNLFTVILVIFDHFRPRFWSLRFPDVVNFVIFAISSTSRIDWYKTFLVLRRLIFWPAGKLINRAVNRGFNMTGGISVVDSVGVRNLASHGVSPKCHKSVTKCIIHVSYETWVSKFSIIPLTGLFSKNFKFYSCMW